MSDPKTRVEIGKLVLPKRKTSRPLPDGVKKLLKIDLNAPILAEESSDGDDNDDDDEVDDENEDAANLMSLEDALLDEIELIDFD